MDEVPDKSLNRRFQFRLSFGFCLIALVAFALAGFRWQRTLDAEAIPSSGALYYLHRALLFLTPLIAPAIVLLVGRGAVTAPMATGFLLLVPLELHFSISGGWGGYVAVEVGLLLGAAFGSLRLLAERISPGRVLIAIVTCFVLGQWLTAIIP